VLRVDNATAADVTHDDDDAGDDWRRSVHFDVGNQLYIGGLPPAARPSHVARHVLSYTGFVGCLAAVDLDGDDRPLFEQIDSLRREFRDQIVQGCEGLSIGVSERVSE